MAATAAASAAPAPVAAAAAAVTIKAIDASAVHRIQSGQVIVNLCSVAKELVENSLDAGATSIEVRFKNQGLDAIEVQDNGSGIAPQNYANLALKHYTSKLATYDDLDTLQTFGFRGEALSSLCALSRFSVTTCLAADVPKGTRLDFETSGRLGPTSVVAAQKGTTVSVEGLFWNLPVRRRELERNIKREWAKVIGLLNQYACVQTGVKFTVSQQPSKGKKVVLFSTKGNAATRDNIINVFGAKTMGALLALDMTLEMTATKRTTTTVGGASPTHDVHVSGYVSRPAHGQGRQTPDRQMFYVNGRPCKLPQFAQLFGEVYRSYNSGQSPFIFADIQLDTHLYDVNVSPDKQTILLHDQGRMLDTLRESLIELFEKQDITVPIGQLSSQKLTAFKKAAAPPSAPSSAAATASAKNAPVSSPVEGKESDDEEAGEVRLPQVLAATPTGAADRSDHNTNASSAVNDGTGEPEATQITEDISTALPTPKQNQSREDASNIVVYPGPRKRLSDEIATVTVGGTTASMPVLSSAGAKRPKTTAFGSSARDSRPMSTSAAAKGPKAKRTKAPLPSFGGRLTQMFSAARRPSQEDEEEAVEVMDDGDEEDDDDEEFIGEDDGTERSSEVENVDEEMDDRPGAEVDDDADEDLNQEMLSDDGGDKAPLGAENDDDDDHLSNPLPTENTTMKPKSPDEQHQMDDVEDIVRDAGRAPEEVEVEDDEEADEENDDGDGTDPVLQNGRSSTTTEARGYTDDEKRSRVFLKPGGSKKRHETLQLVHVLKVNEAMVRKQALSWHTSCSQNEGNGGDKPRSAASDGSDDARTDTSGGLDDTEAVAEAKLALTIIKSDFAKMRVIGQFNLGFILAVREATRVGGEDVDDDVDDADGADGADGESGARQSAAPKLDDELFIIDQHASDEKYNFERLQASTVVQSQRLVQPKRLELTAVEEEIVLEHLPALAANGFVVDAVLDGSEPVGRRCRLRTLPLSRETTFDLTDLEELIALLGDHGDSHDHGHDHDHGGGVPGSQLTAVPRPAKVRKMFAMRACRSSIMIGKALSRRQMASVLSHMGEMDKPWNCPHGRPTMRHLCSLGAAWEKSGCSWGGGGPDVDDNLERGDNQSIHNTEWGRFLRKRRRVAKT
ncbi:DNA mismatch repair protein PMS2 [Sporothrix schenckii 1099-18]|uniref:DNA mismatch repair protein PMS1 n=1 Tax=Sporothrix schenckii 1099-18 TaxID=1397361 RepID=A0A0F2M970_SPOSC|nr:DNA mismatch repair protein PMS2 [Sporothrix schenckii 1099-18]KJR84706.1 DNA mismatch repair protein PMS2 [Sporothrix schenckii 1099-18]